MNKEYRITTDLFTVPYKEDEQLIYAPRIGFLCAGNHELVDLLARIRKSNASVFGKDESEALDFLEKNKILNGNADKAIPSACPEKFTPTTVTLFPTNQCNLIC